MSNTQFVVINRNPAATQFTHVSQPNFDVTFKHNRAAKFLQGGKKVTNLVTEIKVQAVVPVPVGGCSTGCSDEVIAASVRLSGSVENSDRRLRVLDVLQSLIQQEREKLIKLGVTPVTNLVDLSMPQSWEETRKALFETSASANAEPK